MGGVATVKKDSEWHQLKRQQLESVRWQFRGVFDLQWLRSVSTQLDPHAWNVFFFC